jgi:hypothetical protein
MKVQKLGNLKNETVEKSLLIIYIKNLKPYHYLQSRV